MKTIRQIADELGVSKQAVYKRFKGKLHTVCAPYAHTEQGVLYLEEQGETLIKQDFLQDDRSIGAHTDTHAEAVNVSRQAVSKWESGGGTPSTENLRGLSELYGVSVDYLLNEEERKPENGNVPKDEPGIILRQFGKREGRVPHKVDSCCTGCFNIGGNYWYAYCQ